MNMNKHIPAICAEIITIIILLTGLSRFTNTESFIYMLIAIFAACAVIGFIVHITMLVNRLSELEAMKKKQDEKGTEEEKHTGKEISKGTSIITLEDLESALIKLGYAGKLLQEKGERDKNFLEELQLKNANEGCRS